MRVSNVTTTGMARIESAVGKLVRRSVCAEPIAPHRQGDDDLIECIDVAEMDDRLLRSVRIRGDCCSEYVAAIKERERRELREQIELSPRKGAAFRPGREARTMDTV
jgi:hypothetical protein